MDSKNVSSKNVSSKNVSSKNVSFYAKVRKRHDWQSDTVVERAGQQIIAVQSADPSSHATNATTHRMIAIPGIANVHSHAFQFGFAGLSEFRTSRNDSFWTWRNLMYEFLETQNPDTVHKIGLELYGKMRDAGYTSVGEFHYLLHQNGGTPYDNPNEMADALIEAAQEIGINICMLPVLYQRGGFDESELQGGQLRFRSDHDLFLNMLEKLKTDHRSKTGVRLGFAIHSLRAVSVESAQRVIADADSILPGCPIHIHVAEQIQEVEDCVTATQKRPVELLLDSFEVDERWCLIHATHMTDDELSRAASCGAVVGVCPTTEANLGDGIFRSEDFLLAGGRLAIGSDSHISVDPREELRWLEYAQRLTQQRRAVLCTEQESCGKLLTQWTSDGGAQALGVGPAEITPGTANGVTEIPMLDIPERSVDHWIFANH